MKLVSKLVVSTPNNLQFYTNQPPRAIYFLRLEKALKISQPGRLTGILSWDTQPDRPEYKLQDLASQFGSLPGQSVS
jgi:hypothetical protein